MRIFQYLHNQSKKPIVLGFICSAFVHFAIFAGLFIASTSKQISQVGSTNITMSLASFNTNSLHKNYSTPVKSIPKRHKPKRHHKHYVKKKNPKNPVPIQEKPEPRSVTEEQTQKTTKNLQAEETKSAPSNQTSEGSTYESLAYNEGVTDEFLRKIQDAIRRKHHYPRIAKIRELQGIVVVEFVLNMNGSIENLKIFSTTTGEILNQQALKTIKEAHKNFPMPTKRVRLKIPIEYELEI